MRARSMRAADVGHCRQPSCWYAGGEAPRGMQQGAAPVLPGLPAGNVLEEPGVERLLGEQPW